MRWNCPHCRTQLAAADDEIASSWSFALCALCSRFGLVRKSSPLAVKVDRAPAGEKFIRGAITGPAPVVRPAQPRKQEALPTQAHTQAQTQIPVQAQKPLQAPRKTLEARLPEPLPEVPEKRRFSISRFVFFSCVAVLAWNGYRYHRVSSANAADLGASTSLSTSSDTIVANEMAPQHIDVGATIAPRSLNVLIRNNPGRQFPVIGALDPSLRYSVLEVQPETDGQWYRVDAGTRSPAWVSNQDVSPAN